VGQTRWRLTERALALIAVVIAMIIAAAVVVVGLTALQVTAESYNPHGTGQVAQR
jgi:cell division protein FtsL